MNAFDIMARLYWDFVDEAGLNHDDCGGLMMGDEECRAWLKQIVEGARILSWRYTPDSTDLYLCLEEV